jgi:hypothetical protein
MHKRSRTTSTDGREWTSLGAGKVEKRLYIIFVFVERAERSEIPAARGYAQRLDRINRIAETVAEFKDLEESE